jgi:hypothetical protein
MTPAIATDLFHAHLDVCGQCEAHPFDLCKEGDRLIRIAAGIENMKSVVPSVRCETCGVLCVGTATISDHACPGYRAP